MATSYNGWPANTDPNEIHVQRFTVPYIDASVSLTIRKEVAPVLLALACDFHEKVDRLDNRITDDWGYAYREIRGGGPLSCHASGTAIDLNATKYPMGRSNMTAKQVKAVRAILKRYRVVRWGGDFSGSRVDQMHFEIAPGVSMEDVKAVIRDLGLQADGTYVAVPDYPGKPLKVGTHGPAVKAVQRGLSMEVSGVYDLDTKEAVRAFQKKRPWLYPANGVCREATYKEITKKLR